jgi:hypothetical protein
MGLLWKERGQSGKAASYFGEALRLNPNYAAARAAMETIPS